MEVKKLFEAGLLPALYGMGLSHGVTDHDMKIEDVSEEVLDRLVKRARILANKDGGHNKFLESIVVWFSVRAPRYFWSEFDTYRVGMTKQSESTIHTITKRHLTWGDFHDFVPTAQIECLNSLIDQHNDTEPGTDKEELFDTIKGNLPEGFLQTRQICVNYKTLKNIINQRRNHRLQEWQMFIAEIVTQVDAPEFLIPADTGKKGKK